MIDHLDRRISVLILSCESVVRRHYPVQMGNVVPVPEQTVIPPEIERLGNSGLSPRK
jgi:hypothetical protein